MNRTSADEAERASSPPRRERAQKSASDAGAIDALRKAAKARRKQPDASELWPGLLEETEEAVLQRVRVREEARERRRQRHEADRLRGRTRVGLGGGEGDVLPKGKASGKPRSDAQSDDAQSDDAQSDDAQSDDAQSDSDKALREGRPAPSEPEDAPVAAREPSDPADDADRPQREAGADDLAEPHVPSPVDSDETDAESSRGADSQSVPRRIWLLLGSVVAASAAIVIIIAWVAGGFGSLESSPEGTATATASSSSEETTEVAVDGGDASDESDPLDAGDDADSLDAGEPDADAESPDADAAAEQGDAEAAPAPPPRRPTYRPPPRPKKRYMPSDI